MEDAFTYLRYPGSHHARIAHDERAGEAIQGGKAQDEGGGSVPERDRRVRASHGDCAEEQRGMGAEALPGVGRP